MTRSDDLRAQAAALEARAVVLETQLDRAALADMQPDDIEEARVAGRLGNLLGITDQKESTNV
jgi:hypothetical protein